MKHILITVAAVLVAGTAFAEPLKLTLADPQPDDGDLSPGLAVSYAYPSDVRTLADAESALSRARPGPPLAGLSFEDNTDGDITLTSRMATKVAARIEGFVRFEDAGTFTLDFLSNDGLAASVGGQQVALYDDIHACASAGAQEVTVPEAGWYALSATYFQRKGTACLMMDWDAGGEMAPVPDAAFAHME